MAQRTRDILEHFRRGNARLLFTVENPQTSLLAREAAVRDVAQALVAQSTQESPLAAALLLEQAALCFRSSRMPMARKYARRGRAARLRRCPS